MQRVLRTRRLERENRELREVIREGDGFGELIGRSEAMARLYRTIEKVAVHRRHGAGRGGVGNRQGAGGAESSSDEPQGRSSLCRGQLRRDSGNPDRE